MRSASPEEAASILEAARSVIIIPGYGMAVAQAQHKIREMFDAADQARRGREIRDPSGGGPHAGPHERAAGGGRHPLRQAESRWTRSTASCAQCRRGARDRRERRGNPAARHGQDARSTACRFWTSDKAHTVMVIKRSMSPGFAGIDNELYYMDKTLMLFGDAKAFVSEIVKELPARVAA